MSIFKACDIRGVVGTELNPELFRKLGRGIATMMGERERIVVGGDLRASTESLKAELIRGLTERDRTVTDLGVVPTPVVYFAKHSLPADACAIVTASHNPPAYNGLKFMVGDLPVLPEDTHRLCKLVTEMADTPASADTTPRAVQRNALGDYEKWVVTTPDTLLPASESAQRKLSVVVDPGNGTYSEIAPRAFDRVRGVVAHRLFCTPDGASPERDPNCAVAKNLGRLCERVREVGADAGIAFDGDGDRVAFVDERGDVISADEMIVLLLRWFGDRLKGEKFVYDLKCSQIIAREAEQLGAIPLMERSGHAFIKRRMITENAFFGTEISGHYFYRVLYGGDDGLFTALLVTKLLQRSDAGLSVLRAAVPRRFITDDVRLSCPASQASAFLDRVRDAFPDDRRSELDGIRVSLPRGWALLRASITEPKITLRFEGEDAASLDESMEALLHVLPELREGVRQAVKESK